MIKINPQIEPFVNCIKKLNIGDYIISDDFKRYCIKNRIEQVWDTAYQKVQEDRRYFSPDIDHAYLDSIAATVVLLNALWQERKEHFYAFSADLLTDFSEWSGQVIDMTEISKDLELLNFPDEYKKNLLQLSNKGVPKTEFPKDILDSNLLYDYLIKMDDSINSKDYKLTLTYAYTCLEGIYKTFIKHKKIPQPNDTDSIVKLSTIVKNYLIEDFKGKNIEVPQSMLNLISTVTHTIADARNSYSASHFDKDSEKWMAEFVRDIVNSIGRMIINFI